MTWWQASEWPTAEEWQAVWAFVTVLVAAVAAVVALVQHRASVRSRIEQARPLIIVDFAFIAGSVISFEVKNTGLTAATDVTFDWSERPIAQDDLAQAPIDRTLVDGGIPFLAPGRVIRFYFGPFEEDTTPRRYEVNAKYNGSGDGRRWESKSVLDLDQWAHALVDRDPNEPITRQLKSIANSLRKGEDASKNMARAADALHLYLEEKPEVQNGRAKVKAMWEERARLHREDIRLQRMEGNQDPDTGEPLVATPPADATDAV